MLAITRVGCRPGASHLVDLDVELEDAGYTDVSSTLDIATLVLAIEARTPEGTTTVEDADTIAEIAWTTFREDFTTLRITVNGTPTPPATAADLAERFGERPAGLVAPPDDGPNFTLAVVLALALVALLAGLVLVIWWRGRRLPFPPPPLLGLGRCAPEPERRQWVMRGTFETWALSRRAPSGR